MSESTSTPANLSSDILRAFRAIDFSSASELRRDAIAHFERIGLPHGRSEEYRFTPIARVLEKNFSAAALAATAPSTISSLDEYLIPSYACHRIVFVNGRFSARHSAMHPEDHGITVLPLAEALRLYPGEVSRTLGQLAPPSEDAFAAFNLALWQDGVFLRIADNAKIAKPVFILYFNDAVHQPVASRTRLLAIVGKHAEVHIVEKSNSTGEHPVFHSTVGEIEVNENATLHYHSIQNDAGKVYQVAQTRIHQADGSRVNTFTITLDGQLIRNNLGIAIDGERCESHLFGLYLLHKHTHADNHTVVDHKKPNSFSNELYKGILDENSRGVFNGKIFVRPRAQKTNAFQSNRNILLSESSTINTKPQLEIWADDVKCSHGCTSGQLDEEALFYLRSRGISRHTARAMVLNAFTGEILQPISDDGLKSFLIALVSERLLKHF